MARGLMKQSTSIVEDGDPHCRNITLLSVCFDHSCCKPKCTNSNTESHITFPRFSAHKLLKVPTCKKNKDVAHSSNQTFKRILG